MARVLIVTNEPWNAELAAILCKNAGHQVSFAANGLQALMLLDESAFDVLLGDLAEARFCGRALAGAVRLAARPAGGLPIVAMANRLDTWSEQELAALGISAVVTRPLRPEPLRRALMDACRHQRWVEITPLQHEEIVHEQPGAD